MKNEHAKAPRPLAIFLYVLSLLLMLAVAAITLWPEMEVLFFDRPLIIEEKLRTLHCPQAITRDENATIAATFTNDDDQTQSFRARARVSYLSSRLADEFDRQVELAPGETEVVRWTLDPESAAFGRMILARVHVSRRGPTPPQQQGCGVLVLSLPFFTGAQYVYGMVGVGLLALAGSAYLWLAGRPLTAARQELITRRRALLAAVVAGAMFAGLLNLWALGALLLLIAMVLVISFSQ